jgi:hypothetical protein
MNIITNKSIVHIGLQKTGSTYLQKNVFRGICENLGYTYVNDSECFQKIKTACVIYDRQNNEALSSQLKSHARYLLSYEGLVGNLPDCWEMNAKLIKDIFGDVAVLVTVRDPYQYLSSLFLQKVKEGQFLYEDEFLGIGYRILSLGYCKRAFSIMDFDYSKLKNIYESTFEEVHFVPFDDLIKSEVSINGKTLEFESQRAANKSLSTTSVNLIRFVGNRFPRLSRVFNENMNFDDFIRLRDSDAEIWSKPRLSYSLFTRRFIDKFFKRAPYTPNFNFTPDQIEHLDRQQEVYRSLLETN